jgi:hypothetical protein
MRCEQADIDIIAHPFVGMAGFGKYSGIIVPRGTSKHLHVIKKFEAPIEDKYF